ncbi:MAG: rhomboid family intramembrane serine protease [Chloroflexota bacterium]
MNSAPYSQNNPEGYSPPPAGGPVRIFRRPTSQPPYITYFMIATCVLAFLGQMLSESLSGVDLLAAFGAKINPLITAGEYWRLITPMWLHGSILHIAFNMYALFIFGSNLERYYGHNRFLLLYLISGYAGNVISFLMTPRPSLGSSTAIFGLLAAQAVFLYQNRHLIRNARSLLTSTLMIAAINLLLGTSPGIDNWGHLGGLLGGLAFAWSAGPYWTVQADLNGVSLVNQRSRRRVVLVAAGVTLVFTALAVLRIWMG